MISETAFFVQDVMGPRGSVSIAMHEHADVSLTDNHTRTDGIRLHDARVDSTGAFVRRDALVPMSEDGGLQSHCNQQEQFVLNAIRSDLDLREHMDNAITLLSVVLAAVASVADGDAKHRNLFLAGDAAHLLPPTVSMPREFSPEVPN